MADEPLTFWQDFQARLERADAALKQARAEREARVEARERERIAALPPRPPSPPAAPAPDNSPFHYPTWTGD